MPSAVSLPVAVLDRMIRKPVCHVEDKVVAPNMGVACLVDKVIEFGEFIAGFCLSRRHKARHDCDVGSLSTTAAARVYRRGLNKCNSAGVRKLDGVAVGDEGIGDHTEHADHHDDMLSTNRLILSESAKRGSISGSMDIGTCGRVHGCLRDRVCGLIWFTW